MHTHLFLSPHLDDAVLSCGDYIVKLLQDGEKVKVVTIFTGYPVEGELSDAAKKFHEECGCGNEPIKYRCAEDAAAMNYIGCEYSHLGLYECLYRKDDSGKNIYSDLEDIYHLDFDAERAYIQQTRNLLLQELENYDYIYAPLGIGNHADHLLVHSIIEDIKKIKEMKVFYYQDFPYVINSCINNITIDSAHPYCKRIFELSEKDILTKLAAIRLYNSQIKILFDSDEHMQSCVYEYSKACSNKYNYSICFYE